MPTDPNLNAPPARIQSSLHLKPEDAVNVILSLHGEFRSHVQFWHDQVFKAATVSLGAIYALVGYLVGKSSNEIGKLALDPTACVAVLGLVLLLGAISGAYLRYCENAYRGNWRQIVNCELALRLHEPDVYFAGRTFFSDKLNEGDGEFGRGGLTSLEVSRINGMDPDDIRLIFVGHMVATAAAALFVVWLRFGAA